MPRSLAFALCLLALSSACAKRDAGSRGEQASHGGDGAFANHRGVCLVAGGPVDEEVFLDLRAHGVQWISQTPFGWQRRAHEPRFEIVTDGPVYWGETDEGLAATTQLARKHGIDTMLKPHLWLLDRSRGQWEGSIAMRSDADWRRWFENYELFVVHYAMLADSIGAAAFCIGTELEGTTDREAEWRRIIASVRRAYHGPITYAANWSGEFERIRFWDALDFIGIQAYFPVATAPQRNVDSLVAGWQPVRARLEALARHTGKPIVFTEIGYRSERGTAVEPWRWRAHEPADSLEQAACYEAAFRALWNEEWFGGFYWWKWFPSDAEPRAARDVNFSPQGKPAAEVMRRWYESSGEMPVSSRPFNGRRRSSG
jgi:hypothetical protein